MKNRFLLTAVMMLFACVAAKGQAQKLTAMKDAGALKYKGVTYHINIESVGKDAKGNTTVEIASNDAKVPVSSNNTEQIISSVSKYIMVKIVAGDQTYNAQNVVIKNGSVNYDIGGDGSLASQWAAPRNVVYTFETAAAPDRIIVYNDDVESISFDVPKTAGNPAITTQTAPQPAAQQPAQQYQTYQQPTTQAQPATQQYQQYQQPTAQKQQASAAKVSTPVKQTDEFRKWYIESGLSIYVLTEDVDSYVFAGFILNGGFYSSPNSRFSLDMSFNLYSEDAGTFTYTKSGSSKEYTDGKITHDYWAIPVQFTWNYIFNLGRIFKLRLGPSAGFTSLSESYSYSPQVDNAPDINTGSGVMLSAGGGIGATWNIKRCFIDTGYKLLWNSETDITDTTIAHQITVTFGWRF